MHDEKTTNIVQKLLEIRTSCLSVLPHEQNKMHAIHITCRGRTYVNTYCGFLQYFQRAHTESLRSPIRTGNVSQYFTKLKVLFALLNTQLHFQTK